MFKDYYSILEISQSASQSEIKTAYKKQATRWHPDKNQVIDTTEKMKEVNEAKLILSDNEARIRYDVEYLKFKTYKKKKHSQKESKYEKKRNENNSTYQFDDEILKKWMGNAKKQAIRNIHGMINEFRDSTFIGLSAFFKTALMVMVISFIYFVIIQIIKLI